MKHPLFAIALLTNAVLAGCGQYGQRQSIPITQASMSPVLMSSQTPTSAPDPMPAPTRASKPASGRHASAHANTPAGDPVTPAPTSRPEMVAASVLQINNTFLTVDDVLQRKRVELNTLGQSLSKQSFRLRAMPVIQDGIRELVQQSLIYTTAFDRLGDEQKEQIETEVKQAKADMLTKAGGSKAKLEQELAKENLTIEKALEDHKKKLVIEMYLRWKFQPSVYVGRKLMWEYYQARKDEFTAPAKVQMQMIVVDPRLLLPTAVGSASDTELLQARKQAQKLIDAAAAELKKGADFSDVVKKYSNDPNTLARKEGDPTDAKAAQLDKDLAQYGLWPLMQQGSHMLSKVEAAAFGMSTGQVSDVIEDSGCFVIVKAYKVQAGGVTSFEDSQSMIEEKLRHAQYKKMQDEYYDKLTKSAVIVQSPDFVERCIDRAVDKYGQK